MLEERGGGAVLTLSRESMTKSLHRHKKEFRAWYYRARYYDALPGRFISEDPINFLGGFNFYRYVSNNPLRSKDPKGLGPSCACKVAAGALAGGSVGSGVGSVLGGFVGGVLGALGGGGGGTLAEPGGGTIVGGIVGGVAGASAGSRIGSGVGGAIGALIGGIAGHLSCSTGRQSKCVRQAYIPELKGCSYTCDDGSVWFDRSCDLYVYKNWGE